jgi:hypothetical protein
VGVKKKARLASMPCSVSGGKEGRQRSSFGVLPSRVGCSLALCSGEVLRLSKLGKDAIENWFEEFQILGGSGRETTCPELATPEVH